MTERVSLRRGEVPKTPKRKPVKRPASKLARESVVRVPVPVSARASSCDWSASPKPKRTSRAPIVPAKKMDAVVKRSDPFAPKE